MPVTLLVLDLAHSLLTMAKTAQETGVDVSVEDLNKLSASLSVKLAEAEAKLGITPQGE